MFKYARVQVNRSETTTLSLDIPPWEVPVLAAVNGADRVIQIGETVVRRPLPSAAAEYDRLLAKYKDDKETGQDFVATVYGVGQRGVAALEAEIAKAGAAAPIPPQQPVEYDSKDDPLLGLFTGGPQDLAAEAVEITE